MLGRVLYALRPPHIDCFRKHAPTLVVAMVRMQFVRALVSGMDGAENLEKRRKILLNFSIYLHYIHKLFINSL